MPAERFDLIVIGAGPAGYVAALRAAQLGMRVACVEKDQALGGTCLNVGCIPSKALLDSSELYRQAQEGLATHGIRASSVTLDLPVMMARKDKVVRGLTQGVAGLFKKSKIEWVAGAARLGKGTQVVVGERTLEAERVLIATGSEPTPLRGLPFDGERVVSSTEALSLARVPERLLVIGAGAVGLELGSVWSRLGARVTVVEFLDAIVPTMDRGMGAQLKRAPRSSRRGRTRRRRATWCWSRSAAGRTLRASAHARRASCSTSAASSRWTSASRPACRACTRSATPSRAPCSRTRPRRRASPPSS
jgi:dihydrolipoamide dehydrogenase